MILQAPARRSCDVLDALPLGEAKRVLSRDGVCLSTNFTLKNLLKVIDKIAKIASLRKRNISSVGKLYRSVRGSRGLE